MRLFFAGHDYKYAVEQMLLTLFPGQRPTYPEGAAPALPRGKTTGKEVR